MSENVSALGADVVSAASTPAAAAPPLYSAGYKRWVLLLLCLIMVCNYIDRTIMRVLAHPIKAEFQLSDFQVGLLGGFAFAILYLSAGLPIARLAERRSRINIITTTVVVWSLMTALCGLATSYLQLLLFRVGVGVGEAGAGPPSHALTADYFPAHQRASAAATNSFGISMGGLLGSVIGGLVAQAWGWRAALLVVGLPGLLLAVIFRLTIKEPPRGHSDPEHFTRTMETPSFLKVAAMLFRNPTFLHLAAGASIANFAIQGILVFEASYLLRRFDVNLAQVGLIVGIVGGASHGLGVLVGGFATDWLGKRDKRWYAWLPAVGLVVAGPLYALAFLQTTVPATAAFIFFAGFTLTFFQAPTLAVMNNISPPRMRATTISFYFMVTALIGLALGPVIVGLAADHFSSIAFGRLDAGGDFAQLCKGGEAAANTTAALHAACHAASTDGIRAAMIAVCVLFAWASAHFLFGARHIRRDMAVGVAA